MGFKTVFALLWSRTWKRSEALLLGKQTASSLESVCMLFKVMVLGMLVSASSNEAHHLVTL